MITLRELYRLYTTALMLCIFWAVQGQNINRPSVVGPGGLQVNSATGNLFYQRSDFFVPGEGLPIDITFSYNSYQNIDQGFGLGWTFNYNMSYAIKGDTVVIERMDGRSDLFRKTGGDGSFQSPTGVFDALTGTSASGFTLTSKDGMQYLFEDAIHRKLTRIVDPNGNTLQLSYTSNFLTGIRNASGRTVSFTWQNGKLTAVAEDNSTPTRTVSLTYDKGQLKHVTHPDGKGNSYEYTKSGKLAQVTDRNGNQYQIEYNSGGQAKSLISCLNTQRLTYNTESRKTYVIEESASARQVTTYGFDTRGDLAQKEGNCCGLNTKYSYDAAGNMVKRVDAGGNANAYTYDSQGNMVSAADAMGASVNMEYDPVRSRITNITDKRGNVTAFQYDTKGNLLSMNQPLGVNQHFTYDAKGNMLTFREGNGNESTLTYDSRGNVTQQSFPIGSERFTYDDLGNLSTSSDANNNTVEFTYDAQNRLTRLQDDLANKIEFVYDGNGNIVTLSDPNDKDTRYSYDALNRLVRVELPMANAVTSYDYDGTGNLVSVQDANNHTVRYTYNDKNLVESEVTPEGRQTAYTYDVKGNVLTRTDARGKITAYQYDALDRLVKKQYEGNTDEYSYDRSGNITRCKNKFVEMIFEYDALDRLVSKSIPTWNKTITYTYDANSNRTSMIDPDGGVTHYTYDGNNRLTAIINPQNLTITFEYDAGGRMIKQRNFNGTYSAYTYDNADRLTDIKHYDTNNEIFASYAYTYDKNGNRLSMATPHGEHRYTYDAVSRATNVIYPNGTTEAYTFDPTGNRTQIDRNAQITTYTYDASDRLKTAGNASYVFNENGNLVSKTTAEGMTAYTYDGEDRLVRITLPNGNTVGYEYDPFGNRIRKYHGTENTRYLLDNQNVLIELSSSGNTVARYSSALGLDTWLSMERNGINYIYHKDALGSVTALTAPDARVSATYQYDIYGNVQVTTGNVGNPYTYTGREYDAEVDLYYYRSRYYSPKEGRFITKDEFEGFLGNPLSMNKYSYTECNPIMYTDANGKYIQVLARVARPAMRFVAKQVMKHVVKRVVKYFKDKHCDRNQFNEQPSRMLPSGSPQKFIDSNGREWELQPDNKNWYHQPFSPEEARERIDRGEALPYKKYTSVVKATGESHEGIWNGNRWLESGEAAGPSYNFSHPSDFDGRVLSYLWDNGNHVLLDMIPDWIFNCDEPPAPGPPTPPQNSTPPGQPIPSPAVVQSKDPNDITGPTGYGTSQWVSSAAALPYRIRFENDPDFATAPAQNVVVKLPIDPNINGRSLQLGDFGFGSFVFKVPTGSKNYSTRLDVTDSLGVVVDVLAGVDIVKNEAFWIFESKDPVTGLAPQQAHVGFLPVNDSIRGNGEGFVSLSLASGGNVSSGDSLRAQAVIIFDVNESIATNRWVNIVDAVAPTSKVKAIPAQITSPYTIEVEANDDPIGSGIKHVDLFVSENGSPFNLLEEAIPTGTAYVFEGETGKSYCLLTRATDNVGNVEPARITGDVCFTVGEAAPNSPRIVSFTPTRGLPGTTTVTVTGENLGNPNNVKFNGFGANQINAISATVVKSVVPHTATTGKISLTTPNGFAISTTDFEICDPIPVTVTIVSDAPGNESMTGIDVLFTATVENGGTNASYQWQINEQDVDGETNPTFVTNKLKDDDNVRVQVISSDPCARPTPVSSQAITMKVDILTSVEKELNQALTISPNPSTDGLFVFRFQNLSLAQMQVAVIDVKGNVVFAQERRNVTGASNLNLSSMPAGVYYVKILTERGNVLRKIMRL